MCWKWNSMKQYGIPKYETALTGNIKSKSPLALFTSNHWNSARTWAKFVSAKSSLPYPQIYSILKCQSTNPLLQTLEESVAAWKVSSNLSSFTISWGAAKPRWHYQSIDLRQNDGPTVDFMYIKVYESTWNFSVFRGWQGNRSWLFAVVQYPPVAWMVKKTVSLAFQEIPKGMTRYDTQRLSGNFPDAIFKTVPVQQNMGLTFWKPGPQNHPKFISPFMAWWQILKMTGFPVKMMPRWDGLGRGLGQSTTGICMQVFPDPIGLLPRKEAQGTCPKMRSSKLCFKPWRFPKTPNTWHINLHSNCVFSSLRSNTSGNTEWMAINMEYHLDSVPPLPLVPKLGYLSSIFSHILQFLYEVSQGWCSFLP